MNVDVGVFLSNKINSLEREMNVNRLKHRNLYPELNEIERFVSFSPNIRKVFAFESGWWCSL